MLTQRHRACLTGTRSSDSIDR